MAHSTFPAVQLDLDDHMPLWEIPAPYQRVSTLPELDKLMVRMSRAALVAVDTETRPRRRDLPVDGKARKYHALAASLNEAIGLCFSFQLPGSPAAGEHYYLPIRHQGSTKQLRLAQIRDRLDAFLRDARVRKVFHHAKFDLNVLRQDGFEVAPLPDDTLLLASLLNLYALPRVDSPDPASVRHERYTRERPSLGLKELACRHITPDAARHEHAIAAFRQDFARRHGLHRDDVTYDLVPVDLMVPYAASDTRWTLDLYPLLRSFADEDALRLYKTERALVPILADMEYRGVLVDRVFLERAEVEYAAKVRAARDAVHRAAGSQDFDVDSLPQLIEVFRRVGVPLHTETASGRPSLTKDTLKLLARRLPIAKAVMEYRAAAKLKGTYIDSLAAKLDGEGYLHPAFKSHGTRTGRLSSSNPNCQNIPPAMRAAFLAPEGQVLAMLDYSQIELRLVAHYSQDPVLLDAFRSDEDVHTRTAIEVFGQTDDAEEMARRRKIGKNLNFAICYGAGPAKIAAMSGVSEAESRAHLDRFYQVYGRLARWKREVVLRARATGEVSNLYGRKRWLPILTDPSQRDTRAYLKAERVAVNTLIQGSAADLFKETILNVARFLEERRARTRVVLNVHDELVFYVPHEELALLTDVRRVMEQPSIAADLRVPLVVEVSHSLTNWRDKQKGLPVL